jgi:hypothetical protein
MADTSVDPSNRPDYYGYFELGAGHAPSLSDVQGADFKQRYVGHAAPAKEHLPRAPAQLKYAHPDDLQACAGDDSFE